MVSVEIHWNCFGENSGWAVVESVTGATNPTSILWSTGETVQFITGLANGEHWVMVTDANGCWDKEYFTVACPVGCEIDFTLDQGCEGEEGWASVQGISGALGTTSVLWSTGETASSITGLPSGDHWVMVTDEENCWHKEYFSITCPGDDCAIDFDLAFDCEGEGEGWATVSGITGNSAATSIHWSTGENTATIDDLVSGDYWVTVYESEECWSKQYFTIACASDDCAIDFEMDHGCEAEGEGWATITGISGNTQPTSIHWSTGENTATITGLVSGDYWVTVYESEECWEKQYFSITCAPAECDVELMYNWGCIEPGNGWAVVEQVTGAQEPVEILWSTGATVQYLEGLASGEYWVMVTDANGCWDKESFTVSCPEGCELTFDLVNDCNSEGGWAEVANIQGATGNTEITWSTGEATTQISGLENNEYWAMVMDLDGCWAKQYFLVDCTGDGDELLMLNSADGVSVRTYPIPANNTLKIDITSQRAGVYSITLLDAMGRSLMQRNNESFRSGELRTLDLDISGLNNGSYLMQVKRNGVIQKTEQIVIAR